MEISVLITQGAKQIILTPESDHEKEALRYIGVDDEVTIVKRYGKFCYDKDDHAGIRFSGCQGGWYRPYSDSCSLMFVIREKEKS